MKRLSIKGTTKVVKPNKTYRQKTPLGLALDLPAVGVVLLFHYVMEYGKENSRTAPA